MRAWSRVTLLLRTERGSLGSRLRRRPDGTRVSDTSWPCAETRFAGLSPPSVDARAWQPMRDATAETILEPVADFLAPLPPIAPWPACGDDRPGARS